MHHPQSHLHAVPDAAPEDRPARPQHGAIYEVFVDDDRYSVPTLKLLAAADEDQALEMAAAILAENPHHRGVEVCKSGQRLAGLGAYADLTRARHLASGG